MKWLQRKPLFSSVEDVVSFNTGMTIEEMEEDKEYNIEKMEKVAKLIRDAVQKNQKIHHTLCNSKRKWSNNG